MAEMGHKPADLSPRRAGGMSAMPAIVSDFAAMQRRKCSANYGLMHRSKTAPLFDHLVGAKQDRLRHRKAKRLGSLEVHDHLEFCRKLHREIAWLFAAQNAIHISGGATKEVYLVDSVGEQTAVSGKLR